MELEAVIAAARDRYVERFKLFVDQQRNSCTQGGAEVKFELSEHSGVFRRFYCVDFVKNDDGPEAIELQCAAPPTSSPIATTVGGAKLTIESLRWDDLALHHDAGDLPEEEISAWFQAWFDPDDERHQPSAELSCVIHSLIVRTGTVQIDLGTAPPKSLLDMLELIERAGATSMWIGCSAELKSED